MSHVFYLIYLGLAHPHSTKADQALDLINESLLIITSYHVLVLSPWVTDSTVRLYAGWSLVAVALLCFIINLIFLLTPLYWAQKRRRFLARFAKAKKLEQTVEQETGVKIKYQESASGEPATSREP